MTFYINMIFLPSKGVDMIFNMNSLAPYSRTSIIYEIDLKNQEITIAQPLTPFSKNSSFKELHLTTIVHDKKRKLRVGVECVQFRLIEKYQLANKTNVIAVVLKYKLPILKNNIRSAFRLPLSNKHAINCKIFYNKLEYTSINDFSIMEISLTGIALKIPTKRINKANPLTTIKVNETILITIILINAKQDKPVSTFPLNTKVVRIEPYYTDTQALIGLQILNLKTNHETILNKFIHEAQVDELKRLSRQNL